jgi:hypothetical protein
MASLTTGRTRPALVIAQDPSIRDARDQILTATVNIPREALLPGPWGHRVQVIDYDTTAKVFYGSDGRAYAAAPPEAAAVAGCLADPNFHAYNAYAVVMATLARFEHALGRRVRWAGKSHQLKLAPHAFADANAFYSRAAEGILFGYFPARDGQAMVYTCLSHDVIVHETTHALLDGLRDRFIYPSSQDQAAFHEGFADIVALLSAFSLPGIVKRVLLKQLPGRDRSKNSIPADQVTPPVLRKLALLGVGEQMGEELEVVRGGALRRSVELEPSPARYTSPEYELPHRRGEILVAALMNAFLEIWSERARQLVPVSEQDLDLDRVAEEGIEAANYLLTMVIRAIDYTPPLHLDFRDYLSALLTADLEIRPDDSRYHFRDHLRASFKAYGIEPAQGTPVSTREPAPAPPVSEPAEPGAWASADYLDLCYEHTHFEPMTRDATEVFRFIWDNRQALELTGALCEEAFSQVLSVEPCLRIAPDGFVLRETVAEFYQSVHVRAEELPQYGLVKPEDMAPDQYVPLYGGGTLIFDEFGQLKYYIHNALDNANRQNARIAELWRLRMLPDDSPAPTNFAQAHRMRANDFRRDAQEAW